MLISVTKHLPATSPTIWGPVNVKAPRMFHLPSVWRGLGEGVAPGVCTPYVLAWWTLGFRVRDKLS